MSRLPTVTRQAMELFDGCYRTKNMIREFPKTYRFIEELWGLAGAIRGEGVPPMPSVTSSEEERLAAVDALEEWAISIAHGLECNVEDIVAAVARFNAALHECDTINTDETVWKHGPAKVYRLAVKASNLVDRAEIALRRQLATPTSNGDAATLQFIEALQQALSGVLLISGDDDEPAGFVCQPSVAEKLDAILARRPQPHSRKSAAPPRLDLGARLEDQPGPHISSEPVSLKKPAPDR